MAPDLPLTSSKTPLVVRLMSQRGPLNGDEIAKRMPASSLEQGDIRFTVGDEPADVIVILNYLKYDTVLRAREGYIWNWHNEPIVRTPFAKGYDRIFTHLASADPRTEAAPPILDWWVQRSYDDLIHMPPPEKTEPLSVIASKKNMIDGHRLRNQFIDVVTDELPGIPVFGHGRAVSLADKWDALGRFKFSVAIENTSKPNYWTEKIADCFLSYTVPVYFGATNLSDFFPPDSYIWLPIDSPPDAINVMNRVLREESWSERLPALSESRNLVLENYSLFGQLAARVRAEADLIRHSPVQKRLVHGRRVARGGWVRGQGLVGNLATWRNRQVARRSSKL